jgi:stage II sporulation protein D
MESWMRATTRQFGLLFVCAALLAPGAGLLVPGSALASTAKSSFTIKGAGFGHGIGMSQYGALGFSLHHYSYTAIIKHYYENTSIGVLKPAPEITVLLEDGALTFRSASAANGYALSPSRSYGALMTSSGRIELISAGKSYGTYRTPLEITDKGTIDVIGLGEYRGGLVLRGDGDGGIETVNKLPLQSYVRGVISAEMPSSWPLAALEAQAVAARTYAVAVQPASPDFDVYPDTRSQMYGGVSAETASTNTAAADTNGEIVEHDGLPAVTYFFSSSGGHTESIQNVWLGTEPLAWLKGVSDPYDNAGGNPYYRWKVKLSLASAADVLRGFYKGSLRGIKVLKTGVSPRVVNAEVVGTKGSSDISGPQLQQLFSTMSTYMSFVTVTSSGTVASGGGTATTTTTTTTQTTTTPSGGGDLTGRTADSAPRLLVSGDVFPVSAGEKVTVERLSAGRWVKVATRALASSGSYAVAVTQPGSYRTLVDGAIGPVVSVG